MVEESNLNIVFLGHHNHGKSSLIACLLCNLHNSIQTEYDDIVSLFESSKLDHRRQEKDEETTIYSKERSFDYENREITLIDAPGKEEFIRNCFTAISKADVVVLVVDGTESIQEQTKEHLNYAESLDINEIIVAINKMDLLNYSEEEYKHVKNEASKIVGEAGYDVSNTNFVPVSAVKNENITANSEKMNWYKGPNLIEALINLKDPIRAKDLNLRLPIQNSDKRENKMYYGGIITTGKISKGEKVVFEPLSTKIGKEITTEIKNIQIHNEVREKAEAGDSAWLNFGDLKHEIGTGDVIGHEENPPTVAESFKAEIHILNSKRIEEGYNTIFEISTANVECTITNIRKVMNPKTGETIESDPGHIEEGQSAIVRVSPEQPVVIESRDNIPQLSRFVIRGDKETIGSGQCLKITHQKTKK